MPRERQQSQGGGQRGSATAGRRGPAQTSSAGSSATHRKSAKSSSTSQSKLTSTGSPAARRASKASEGQEATRDALYQRAAALGINGRSRMTKAALLSAIRDREQGRR